MRGMQRPGLFLIDTFGFIFRAYHARARSGAPPMRSQSAGIPTEAVYIFHNMLRKLLTTYSPEYMAAIFESEGPTLREQEYVDYKANRPAMPPDLAEQIPWVRTLLEAMRIPVRESEGYEADDLIGAIAARSAACGVHVTIVSSDKDMLQLVNSKVSMLDPRKDDLLYTPKEVVEFMGVRPDQVADLLALKGDAVDNIPGAPGIGDKGARDLIQAYGSVEGVIEHAHEVKRKSYRESLQHNAEQIRLSKRLATIDVDLPIDWRLEDFAASQPDVEALRNLYRELEFHTALRELEAAAPSPETPRDYKAFASAEELEAYLAETAAAARLAVALAPPGSEDLSGNAFGLAATVGQGRAVPVWLAGQLRGVLEDPGRRKVSLDVKGTLNRLRAEGLSPAGFAEDPVLYNFLLTADPAASTPAAVIERVLERSPSGAVEELADFALELARRLGQEIGRRGLRELHDSIDFPLLAVLSRMETTGVLIEPAALEDLSTRMQREIGRLTDEIHQLAGREFNINSPQQLGKVLYEEMGLPSPRPSGKTKSFSTAAGVLEELAVDHPVAALVLEYRQLAKLKGTYVDALPALVSPDTGRLHTTFNPFGAATGRLSSFNPNLQNIPIRTEIGREIRAAFVPEPGWYLLVADYSQIELRLLAHMSGDPVLVDAFRRGEDIHTRTAAEVFGTPPIAVTPELRRRAKAVNFGIIYGLSAFGLARQLGIPRLEADHYIKSYFERHTGVKRFIDETIAEVRSSGVSKTLFGRERPIPDIKSRNPNARGFAERTAVNTPLQGTAADLIKLAMIRIQERLEAEKLRSRMLLQVHDELVFETPPEEAGTLQQLVKKEMEDVHRLKVPLAVDIGIGDNWRDAK